jgi:hypothetical protein
LLHGQEVPVVQNVPPANARPDSSAAEMVPAHNSELRQMRQSWRLLPRAKVLDIRDVQHSSPNTGTDTNTPRVVRSHREQLCQMRQSWGLLPRNQPWI